MPTLETHLHEDFEPNAEQPVRQALAAYHLREIFPVIAAGSFEYGMETKSRMPTS